MADRKLKWADANLKDGHLTAPIDPPPDEDWVLSFGVALRMMERETRGQVFEGWHVDNHGLHLTGVLPAALRPTADFFDDVCMQTNRELERHLAERARLEGARAEQQESAEAEERAALEELRKRE